MRAVDRPCLECSTAWSGAGEGGISGGANEANLYRTSSKMATDDMMKFDTLHELKYSPKCVRLKDMRPIAGRTVNDITHQKIKTPGVVMDSGPERYTLGPPKLKRPRGTNNHAPAKRPDRANLKSAATSDTN